MPMPKEELNKNISRSASPESGNFELTPMNGGSIKIRRKQTTQQLPPPPKTAGTPLRANQEKTGESSKKQSFLKRLDILISFMSRVSLSEKLFFTENFRVMVKAGLSISDALDTLALQTKNKMFGAVITEISAGVVKGTSLGAMLAKYPKIFPEYFINMIKVGEISGNLEQNLEQLGLQMKKDHELVSKVKGAMTYPIVIVIATVGILILMFIYVIPSITSIFNDMKVELPIATRILMAISRALNTQGVLVGAAVLILGTGLAVFSRTDKGRAINHFLLLRLWIIGPIVHKINLARFARTISSLLKTDIPVIKSFEITSTILGNVYYKKACQNTAEELAKGVAINQILKKTPDLFPPLVTQMVLVGEKSGTIDELLGELAVFYEDEVSDITKNLSSIIEPVLIVFLGGVVGLIAYAVISPIYALTQNI